MATPHLLRRYVPAHFNDPVGLALRLVRTGDPAAWFAMATAAAGVAAAPLDALLQRAERRYISSASAGAKRQPLLFICGPPRSGTTVVYQTLVNHLPVAYFSNLTALFPRSPLSAHRLLERFVPRPRQAAYRSYYGRTTGLAGTNDALHLWDRWLGADRSHAPASIPAQQQQAMQAFFAACSQSFRRPLINKNNNLNATAHLVAESLPEARFLCLTRNRRDLAQSLFRARQEIHGAADQPYGLADSSSDGVDPIASVCEQVDLFEKLASQQREHLGDRFQIVEYEAFCRDPGTLVRRVARELFGDESRVRTPIPAQFAPPRGNRLPAELVTRLDAELAQRKQ